jgi:hypothetical protein
MYESVIITSQTVSASNVICYFAVKAPAQDGKWGDPRLYGEPLTRSSHRYI